MKCDSSSLLVVSHRRRPARDKSEPSGFTPPFRAAAPAVPTDTDAFKLVRPSRLQAVQRSDRFRTI